VVGADDGVVAQTIETISHTEVAGVPIIVAVNKIYKPGADSSRVKNELLSYEIIAEYLRRPVILQKCIIKFKKIFF
jgi:translation initiation factor IF-2